MRAVEQREQRHTGHKADGCLRQSILVHNLKDKAHPKELLTEDVVELLTTPLDLAGYKTAITEALYKGTKRNVESEKDPKNA